MRIIQANIEAILMDRIPDNCTYDCPFCCDKVISGQEVPFCPVINELAYEYTEGIPEVCPLVYDDLDERKEGK